MKGRVGYDAGKVQPYAFLGAGHLAIENLARTATISDTMFLYGAGVDVQVHEHVRVGLEWLHGNNPTYPLFGSGTANVTTDEISLRVNYVF